MPGKRLINSCTVHPHSLVTDADSDARHAQANLRLLLTAAVRDRDDAALRELRAIESVPSGKSITEEASNTDQRAKDRLVGLEFS